MKPPYLALALLAVSLAGCATAPPPEEPAEKTNLTHGQVQITLKKGVTTKTEVIETFGAPNITSTDASGREVWTYQKHGTVAKSSSSESWGTIILFGGSQSAAGFEQSSRTMTLIIKFDENGRVYDFRSRYSSF
jgi:outer membrane protein assembly factor BamE (lipoprotein component of BamABCDE complex)